MRPIKFRSWMVNEMIYDAPVVSFDGVNFSTLTQTGEYDYVLSRRCSAVMQFTGVTDECGKMIYEGDIVAWPHESEDGYCETYHEVYFQDGIFGIEYGNCFYEISGVREIKIIGNKYENPELLTNGEKQ